MINEDININVWLKINHGSWPTDYIRPYAQKVDHFISMPLVCTCIV